MRARYRLACVLFAVFIPATFLACGDDVETTGAGGGTAASSSTPSSSAASMDCEAPYECTSGVCKCTMGTIVPEGPNLGKECCDPKSGTCTAGTSCSEFCYSCI